MPGHTKLKYREVSSTSESDKDAAKAALEAREAEHFAKKQREKEKKEGFLAVTAHDSSVKGVSSSNSDPNPAKKAKAIVGTVSNVQALDEDADLSDESSEESDSDSDSDDDTAMLMAELEKLKKEKAEEEVRKEMTRQAESERIRTEQMLKGNPLLESSQSSFTVRRRWDEDAVFKNCARQDKDEEDRTFINDTLRSAFHRKFMDKYIQ
jgi:protein CWC15